MCDASSICTFLGVMTYLLLAAQIQSCVGYAGSSGAVRHKHVGAVAAFSMAVFIVLCS